MNYNYPTKGVGALTYLPGNPLIAPPPEVVTGVDVANDVAGPGVRTGILLNRPLNVK